MSFLVAVQIFCDSVLLIHCLQLLPLLYGGGGGRGLWFVFCCAVLGLISSFKIISPGKRELVALLVCLSTSNDLLTYMTFPRGVVGWSRVCECGISWSYLLTFLFQRIFILILTVLSLFRIKYILTFYSFDLCYFINYSSTFIAEFRKYPKTDGLYYILLIIYS